MRNKKHMIIILSSALLISAFSSVTQYESAVNAEDYLFYSSFESGNDEWTARGSAKVEESTKAYFKGKQSLFISDRTSSWHGASYSLDSSDFKSGSAYSFDAMVMQDSGKSEEIVLKLQYKDSSETTKYSLIASSVVPDGEWTKLSNSEYIIPEDATDIQLYVETPENLIDFYLDEVYGSANGSINTTPEVTTATTAPSVPAIIYGDIDGNKLIDITDLTYLSLYLLNSQDFDEEQMKKADVTGNGTVDLADLATLKQYLMKDKVILGPEIVIPPVTTTQSSVTTTVTTSVSSTKPIQEPDPDEKLDPKQLSFFKNSIYQMGNTERICNKITQAKKGEKTTIAFIGGSITEGNGLETCYAKRSYNYFASTYGTGSNVKYINAGLSGTSSVVGLMRAQKDILDAKPDVIFIEFSVNDHPEDIYKKGFEALVKKCLSQDNDPAVVIIITRAKGGYSMQTQMADVGKNYNIPVISMDNALTQAFKTGYLQPGDYYSDEYHPHPSGCALISDCISYFFRQAYRTKDSTTPYVIPSTSAYGSEYSTASIIPVSELEKLETGSFSNDSSYSRFAYGWKYNKNSGNKPMTFSTTGKGIFMVFKSNQNSSLGVLNVTVNGKTASISGNRNYAWGGADADIAYIQNETGTLNVSMSMKDANSDFNIYGIGVVK